MTCTRMRSLLLHWSFLLHREDSCPLLGDPLGTAFPSGLVLGTTSLHLVAEEFRAVLLGLGLVDVLHENALVLEDITLRFLVQRVVQMLVNLASLSVLPQKSPQNTLATHPLHLRGHTSLRGTLPFTRTSVPTLPLGGKKLPRAGTGMHGGGLDNNPAVLDEFLNMRTGVGVADLRLFSGVEPDFALANAGDGRGEPLLRAQVDHALMS